MDQLNQKSFERVVSQKAMQMGSSFPCQFCVLGFFSGVCFTTLLLAAFTSLGTFGIDPVTSVFAISTVENTSNSSSRILNMVTNNEYEYRWLNSVKRNAKIIDDNVSFLHSAWNVLLNESTISNNEFMKRVGVHKSQVPKAPHLENCKLNTQVNEQLDSRVGNESYPPWKIRTNEQLRSVSEGAPPPWITGSDDENFPMTRKVQYDIWIHQHPLNCSDPGTKFLVADWERPPGFGIGAQLAKMCGFLAVAINEERVLVTNYFNRADHDGCKASSRAHWSCYFLPETSRECRERAIELMDRKKALDNGIVTNKDSYSSKKIWTEHTPRIWGTPWSYLQPTTEINGSLLVSHRKMDRRWWRAQAVRYLMRFQTKYTCDLLNAARHAAFGREAAKMVFASYTENWPKDTKENPRSEIEEFVWSNHKPWIPRPLLSMHVRMGDKACEMKVVGFEDYMLLAQRIRRRFPQLNNIWLSSEMQEVVDNSKLYPGWNFYYTDVTRQEGNMAMATYEASLGRETSTNYPLVNFLMASQSDFFVGALGSTWCFLIDGMRNTGGKVMAGYLSVNKDRYW